VIELFISEVAYEEALDGNDPRCHAKSMSHYFSGTAITTLGIEVVTSEDAVATVRRSNAARDQRIREGCSLFGVNLSEWIGKD
jgi:hypothetical protein